MDIVIKKSIPVQGVARNIQNYQKLGFWATVTEVNSLTYTCSVITSSREVIHNIPLATKEWISDDSAERSLPPPGSFVFILMPDNCISSAFILCSGYPKGEAGLQTLFASSDDEKKQKNSERETLTPGHWTEKEDYSSGTRVIVSPDEKIEIRATLEDKKSESLEITCFDTTVRIDKDGITFSPNSVTLDAGSGDISISTKGKIKIDAGSVNVNDGALEVT
jgi:hypothetical protein